MSLPDLAGGSRLQPLALTEGQHLRVRWSGSAAAPRTLLVEAVRPGRGILPAGAFAREVRALTATSALRGDVRALLLAADDQRAEFTGPDTLSLGFEVPAAAQGLARSLFVGVQARIAAPSGGCEAASRLAVESPPASFALYQSRPNPARGGVTIPFDLPTEAQVRLEIFDTQGRRVHRQHARLGAGRHEWNLGTAGRSLAPGVYTYRLAAGPYRGQRKLVVLP